MVFVNHFYFYLWDPEWGPAFWKTNAYAPYPVWLWLNGHEWAKRQLDKAGVAYEALDNGFRSCADPRALQRACDRLGSGAVKSFFWRWQRRLPSPFSRADLRAGYVYDLAFRQFEVPDSRVFDRPASGRAFFEDVIRDHLDIGRPDQVALVFDRRISRQTPGSFRTKVITKGVGPQISCYYRSSRIKQYFKEHRALRTETVIGDTRDFGIGRRVTADNWTALRAVGDAANKRLCDAQAADAHPAPDVATFAQVTQPSTTATAYPLPRCASATPASWPCSAPSWASPTYSTASPTANSSRPSRPCSTRPTPAGRPPRTCAGCAARASSPAAPAGSATTSPPTADTRRCCSPKPTAACSHPAWPPATPACRPRSPPAALSPSPGDASTRNSTPSSTASYTPPRGPDTKLDSTVKMNTGKRTHRQEDLVGGCPSPANVSGPWPGASLAERHGEPLYSGGRARSIGCPVSFPGLPSQPHPRTTRVPSLHH